MCIIKEINAETTGSFHQQKVNFAYDKIWFLNIRMQVINSVNKQFVISNGTPSSLLKSRQLKLTGSKQIRNSGSIIKLLRHFPALNERIWNMDVICLACQRGSGCGNARRKIQPESRTCVPEKMWTALKSWQCFLLSAVMEWMGAVPITSRSRRKSSSHISG